MEVRRSVVHVGGHAFGKAPGFEKTKFSQKKNSLDSRPIPDYHRHCRSTIRGRESGTMEASWAMAHGIRSVSIDVENQPRGEVDADQTPQVNALCGQTALSMVIPQVRDLPGRAPNRLRSEHGALTLGTA
ncbi:hypothetical protein CJO92_24465 (plasmid) [Ralstonia solanacearum]|uniref:Uncharacterized protein n=3 Tax=Ralstonia solanacearum species complex TaxID=3116862 RepID=A0AAD0WJ37_RALSL|nr:hypothetical protein B0B51_19425 [blood disease bacterium A2-HR MARDI]AXV84604.1 hypothetical protein CJO77_24450 [Ralstonia solanacearum]AXW55730.1 hypothetical protein CJO92_24465 [Ralstonia solanacearum]CCA82902.1 conserved hypothetical protein [blood disease bacterium R229]